MAARKPLSSTVPVETGQQHAAGLDRRRKTTQPTPASSTDTTATAIHIPLVTLHLLRRVAVERANRLGGRPGVSKVIVELVEAHQAELEAELRQ